MSPEDIIITDEEVEEIYKELDLDEEGITEEEKTRRKRRIFVGGLRYASEDIVLHDYFIKFGDIKEAVIIRKKDDSKSSRGFGFVIMMDDMAALKAIYDKSPKIDGRRCNVNLAYIGQKRKPPCKRLVLGESLVGGCVIYPSGTYLYPPGALVAATGEPYQLGLPPLHGYQPYYHIPPTQSPNNYTSHSPLTPTPLPPITPYQSTVFFPSQFVYNNAPNDNNNNIYQENASQSPPMEMNNNCSPSSSDAQTDTMSHQQGYTTTLALNQQTPDIVPTSSPVVDMNGNYAPDMHEVIVNGKQPISGNTIVYKEPITYHTNNVIPSVHVSNIHQNGHSNNGNVPNLSPNPVVNGNHIPTGHSPHLVNGAHLINTHNAVTTFVTSPLPTTATSVQNGPHHHMFHYQPAHFIPQREVVQ